MTSARTSLITVVYSEEIPLLRLQARSLHRHFQSLEVDKIIVCVNDQDERATIEKVEALRSEYGQLSERLEVMGGQDVFLAPSGSFNLRYSLRRFFALHFHSMFRPKSGWKRNNGWNMQQAFKLAATLHCDSENIILLDAKNIFIRPVDRSDFFDDSGRPRARFSNANMRNAKWYPSSARVLGHDGVNIPREYTSFVTPFCLKRHWVKEILRTLKERSIPVEFIFARPGNRSTEFMMLNAWIDMQGASVRDFFTDGLLRSYTVFSGMDVALAERILKEAFDERGKCIGIHSKLIRKLDSRVSHLVCRHLVEGGIANSTKDAQNLLSGSIPARNDDPGGGG